MLNFNNVKVCEKYIRDSLRDTGLVFKKQGQFYVITDRKTKDVIVSNATLGTTFSNVESGYFSCYDKSKRDFDRQQLINMGLISC